MKSKIFHLSLRHKTSRHLDEPNWLVLAKNKTDARREARRLWVQENGRPRCGCSFNDFKIVWKDDFLVE